MKLLKNKNIAIVGGGPGGLTLARLLQMNGVEVKVYERDEHKDARTKGATLDLHEESGLKALGQAGLMDAFKANYRPGADKLRVVDQNGIIHFDDSEQSMENTYRPEIDRGPLQKILLDSLTPETVVWDSQFVSLNPEGKSLKIAFKNGRTVEADIVIAADGANSKIRSYITPIKPFYAGITILEGAVNDSAKRSPTVHRLLNGGKIFALGSEKSLIVSSKGDGSLVFYTGCKTEENWVNDCGINFSDKSEVISWFKNTFKDWGEIWLELFENTSTPFVPRPQYCMPLDQNWEAVPNLTILGDAAHLMPPYAGEGVNMAMLDALELSNCLLSDKFPDTKSAIAMYEKQMLNRASSVAKQTLDSTDALHAADAVSWIIDLFSED